MFAGGSGVAKLYGPGAESHLLTPPPLSQEVPPTYFRSRYGSNRNTIFCLDLPLSVASLAARKYHILGGSTRVPMSP